MPLHPLVGHFQGRLRLGESFAGGRLPQVILITGPTGIGKQRLALWLGQLLLCEHPGKEPCGLCRRCKLVLNLSHPDLHWFVPIPRPKAGEVDKQIEEAAELLAEAMAARRVEPLYEPADGMSSHPLASAKLLLRRAALTPVEGTRKIFIVGEADRLVPQESSPDAANALLKLLEEPPANTWILLTTTEPDRVLPTIRSRAVPLRLAGLPDAELKRFAEAMLHPVPGSAELETLIRKADGAIGRLVGGAQRSSQAGNDARALLATLKAGRVARFERSLKQAPWSARGGFTDLLDAVAAELAAHVRAAADQQTARKLVFALDRVGQARAEAQGNVNPQLLLAALSAELEEVL